MTGVSFETVWGRIIACEGERFHQVRGGEFTFEVLGNLLRLDRTNQNLPKSVVETALRRVPLSGTSAVHDLRGPSYLYAILMDPRIRQGDW